MKRMNADQPSGPPSMPVEERWIEKRKSLLERLTTGRSAPNIDRKDLSRKREALLLKVEGLEEENHKLARSAKEFELQLSKKTRIYRTKLNRGDDLKKKQVRLSTREHSLLNEMELYESEQVRLTGIYTETSEKLRENIASLKQIIDRIGFTKGEVRTLTGKMAMMEGDIPVKSNEVDNMDETIKKSIRALRGFGNRMQRIERDLIVNYYERKQHARE